MAIYDIAGNMRNPDLVGGLQQGMQFGNALRDLAAKRQEMARQDEVRRGLQQFYQAPQAATPSSIGQVQNPLEALMAKKPSGPLVMRGQGEMPNADPFSQIPGMGSAMAALDSYQPGQPAKPGSYDYEGAMNYAASMGEMDSVSSLAKLRDMVMPTSADYYGTPVYDEDGEAYIFNKRGDKKSLEISKRQPLEVKGGWIIGRDGMPEKPLPNTPAEEARLRAEQERLQLAKEEAARRERDSNMTAEQKAAKAGQERASKYQAVNDLDSVLSAYEAALKGATRAELVNPASDRAITLGSLATQLQMAYKTAADLGAITGPDWAIINRIIATPSGAKAAMLGSDGLLKQVQEVRKLSSRQRQQLDKVFGGDPTQAARQATATNAKGWRLMTDAKGNRAYVSPDGKQFEEVK